MWGIQNLLQICDLGRAPGLEGAPDLREYHDLEGVLDTLIGWSYVVRGTPALGSQPMVLRSGFPAPLINIWY